MQTVYNTVKNTTCWLELTPTDQLPCQANGLTCDLITEASQIMLLFMPCDSMRLTGKLNTAYFQSNVMDQNSGAQTSNRGDLLQTWIKGMEWLLKWNICGDCEHLHGLYHAGGAARCGISTYAVTQRNACKSIMTPASSNDASDLLCAICAVLSCCSSYPYFPWLPTSPSVVGLMFSLDLMHNWNPFY